MRVDFVGHKSPRCAGPQASHALLSERHFNTFKSLLNGIFMVEGIGENSPFNTG